MGVINLAKLGRQELIHASLGFRVQGLTGLLTGDIFRALSPETGGGDGKNVSRYFSGDKGIDGKHFSGFISGDRGIGGRYFSGFI